MPLAALPDSVNARKLHKRLKRQAVKPMLADRERDAPGRAETIFSALQNVAPSQLADRALFDFAGLEAVPGGADDGARRDSGDGVPVRWMNRSGAGPA